MLRPIARALSPFPAMSGGGLSLGLKAYYRLGESSGTRADSKGSNDLTATNGPTNATGIIGSAAAFATASHQYLSRATTSDLEMNGTDFSIVAWIYQSTLANFRPVLAKWASTGGTTRAYLIDTSSSSNKHGFYVSDGTSQDSLVTTATISAGAFYMLAVTFVNATKAAAISINAGSQDTKTMSVAPQAATSAFALAGYSDGGFAWLDGRLDEVGIWKRRLSTVEITQLYNGGSGLAPI